MGIQPITHAELTPERAAAGCFVVGMPNEAYHAYPGISKSGLDLIDRSPSHYRYREPRETSRQMEIGTAIHCALLEPDRYAHEYVLLREVSARTASEYKQACKEHPSERVLVSYEADRVAGMQEVVYAVAAARELLQREGWRELSAFGTDPETGELIKCRFDLLTTDGIAVDLKKTRDARPEKFSRAVYDYRYHVQEAFYRHVFRCATGGKELAGYRLLAVEEALPHSTVVYRLDDEAIAEGARQFRRNLNTYAACQASGDWHGYVIESELLSLPTWVMNQIENELNDSFDAGD